MPTKKCDFRENRLHESPTLLMGISEFSPALATFTMWFGWN